MIEKELQKENEALEEFEVKEIIDHQKNKNGTIKYRVRWEGYGPESDQWEPLGNLEHSSELIDEYHQRKGLKCQHCGRLSYSQWEKKQHEGTHISE